MAHTLTPSVWTLRTGPQHIVVPDPYTFVATVFRCGDTAYVMGGCGAWDNADRTPVCDELREMGFRAVRFERIRDGRLDAHEVTL